MEAVVSNWFYGQAAQANYGLQKEHDKAIDGERLTVDIRRLGDWVIDMKHYFLGRVLKPVPILLH